MEKTMIDRSRVGRQIQLPFSKSVQISLQSIRIRFGRSVVTAGSIFFGIAFFSYVLATITFGQATQGTLPQEELNRSIWLAAMSLVVATVGITNAMLMSVTERYREIGTMKCLGALDSFVVRLFIIESGTLGGIASFSGALLGVLLVVLVNSFTNSEALGLVSWGRLFGIVGLATVLGLILTMIATIFPARIAAKMPPAAALRVDV